MEISNGIFHEGGWSCVPLTFFFNFFAQKISRIVTIKNWMEISDIKSGVGGGWGQSVTSRLETSRSYLIFVTDPTDISV